MLKTVKNIVCIRLHIHKCNALPKCKASPDAIATPRVVHSFRARVPTNCPLFRTRARTKYECTHAQIPFRCNIGGSECTGSDTYADIYMYKNNDAIHAGTAHCIIRGNNFAAHSHKSHPNTITLTHTHSRTAAHTYRVSLSIFHCES